jgi:hypothetical protein
MNRIAVSLLVALVLAAPAGAATVGISRTQVATRIGEKFSFTTTVRNESGSPLGDLVAHLNVLSSDPGTYVDPEDWSSHRTQYLAPIAAHGSRTSSWVVTAVNSGEITIFVSVLPRRGPGQIVATAPLRVEIASRRTLNSGGVLPLALGIPALLGATALGLRARRPRH